MDIKEWTPAGQIEKRTYDEVLEGLREVVATKATDYVYRTPDYTNTCAYWDNQKDCPSCMIGVYLNTIGYEAELLRDLDGLSDPAWIDNPLDLHEGFTDKANDLMKTVQLHQDTGSTWVEALRQGQQAIEDSSVYVADLRVYNDNEGRI